MLRNAQMGMMACLAAALVAATSALTLLLQRAPTWKPVVCAGIVAAAAGFWRALRGLERRMTFADYVHAER